MEGQDIIMLCQQNWNVKLGTNARNLAREFARHNRVLYVNVPLDVSTLLGGFRRPEVRQHLRIVLGLAAEVASVEPGVWVCTPACLALSINWLPAGLFAPLTASTPGCWHAGCAKQPAPSAFRPPTCCKTACSTRAPS